MNYPPSLPHYTSFSWRNWLSPKKETADTKTIDHNDSHLIVDAKYDSKNGATLITAPNTFYGKVIHYIFRNHDQIIEHIKTDLREKFGSDILEFAFPCHEQTLAQQEGLSSLQIKDIYFLAEDKNKVFQLFKDLKTKYGEKIADFAFPKYERMLAQKNKLSESQIQDIYFLAEQEHTHTSPREKAVPIPNKSIDSDYILVSPNGDQTPSQETESVSMIRNSSGDSEKKIEETLKEYACKTYTPLIQEGHLTLEEIDRIIPDIVESPTAEEAVQSIALSNPYTPEVVQTFHQKLKDSVEKKLAETYRNYFHELKGLSESIARLADFLNKHRSDSSSNPKSDSYKTWQAKENELKAVKEQKEVLVKKREIFLKNAETLGITFDERGNVIH